MYTEKIVDIQTGKETLRNYTADEIAAVENAIQENNAKDLLAKKQEEMKAALLEKLGITAEEAALLLGS